jgi:membrane peptidoglycan carboxypeptidase
MYSLGYISKKEYSDYKKTPLNIQPPKTYIRAPHFVFYVISQLEEKYGIRMVEEGGLRVVTTLDLDAQTEAEKILSEEIDKIQNLNVGNGAVLVTAPSTGEILAMVGSKDYFQDPYGAFNVTVAKRQPGSSIKPLMYSLALERNYTAATIIQDSPVVYDIPGSKPYRPENYDGKYHGSVPLRYALANSYNIPAVRVLNTLGVNDFILHARKLGISTWDKPQDYGLSLTLGGGDVRMIDMAEAYGTFANYGEHVELQPFISIEDYKGNRLATIEHKSQQVLSPQTSFIISDILSDNYARQFSFGLQSDLFIPDSKVAVKTGTSNNKRDNWTIGYNRKYLTAVWVGNNDNAPMNPILTSGVTGASPIWNKVMRMVLAKNIPVTGDVQPASEFTEPDGLVKKQCFFGKDEYFRLGTENNSDCNKKVYDITTTPTPAL